MTSSWVSGILTSKLNLLTADCLINLRDIFVTYWRPLCVRSWFYWWRWVFFIGWGNWVSSVCCILQRFTRIRWLFLGWDFWWLGFFLLFRPPKAIAIDLIRSLWGWLRGWGLLFFTGRSFSRWGWYGWGLRLWIVLLLSFWRLLHACWGRQWLIFWRVVRLPFWWLWWWSGRLRLWRSTWRVWCCGSVSWLNRYILVLFHHLWAESERYSCYSFSRDGVQFF